MATLRTCKWCGSQYIDRYDDQPGFCSSSCRDQWEEDNSPAVQAIKEVARASERAASAARAAAEQERRRTLAEIDERFAAERRERERERKRDPKNWFGSEWADHLVAHPEDAFQCDWSKLRGDDLVKVLKKHPDILPDNLDWTRRLTGDCWEQLLLAWPNKFKDRCVWSTLSSESIVSVLKKHPDILSDNLDLAGRLTGNCWEQLLLAWPNKFKDRCVWSTLSSGNLTNVLLSRDSEFKDYELFPWGKLVTDDWYRLLCNNSLLKDKCTKWNFTQDQWVELLGKHPEYSAKFPAEEITFSNEAICQILKKQPQLVKLFKVEELTVKLMRMLLKDKRLAEDFDYSKLTVASWFELLCANAEFVAKCPCINSFTGHQWSTLLMSQPKLEEFCNTELIPLQDWGVLLLTNPGLIERCYCISQFTKVEWHSLLRRRPDYVDKCPFMDEFTGEEWCGIIIDQPSLAKYCDWYCLSWFQWHRLECHGDIIGKDGYRLIQKKQREMDRLVRKFGATTKDFSPEQWSRLLKKEPKFKKRFLAESASLRKKKACEESGISSSSSRKIGCKWHFWILVKLTFLVVLIGVGLCIGASFIGSTGMPEIMRPAVVRMSEVGDKIISTTKNAYSHVSQTVGMICAGRQDGGEEGAGECSIWVTTKRVIQGVGALVVLVLLWLFRKKFSSLSGFAEGGVIPLIGRVGVLGWCLYKTGVAAIVRHNFATAAIMLVVALWVVIKVGKEMSRQGWWRWLLLAGCFGVGLADMQAAALAGAVALLLGPAKLKG